METTSTDGSTAHHLATRNGYEDVVRQLLQGGANPSKACDRGETPLHQAAANGHKVVGKLLVESGADPNAVDSTKQTPAAQAKENNYHTLANILQSLEITRDYRTAELIQQSDLASCRVFYCNIFLTQSLECIIISNCDNGDSDRSGHIVMRVTCLAALNMFLVW